MSQEHDISRPPVPSADADLREKLDEVLRFLGRDGGVFAAIRELKTEIYRVDEKVSKALEAASSIGALKGEIQVLQRKLDEDHKRAHEQSAAAAESLRKELSSAVETVGARVQGVENRHAQAEAAMEKRLLETEKTRQADSAQKDEVLRKISGAMASHGDTLDALSRRLQEQEKIFQGILDEKTAELSKKAAEGQNALSQNLQKVSESLVQIQKALEASGEAARQAFAGQGREIAAVEQKLLTVKAELAKGTQESEARLSGQAVELGKRVKESSAEIMGLQAHFETFAEGQRVMAAYFNEQKQRDAEARERERIEIAREANNRGAAFYHQGAWEAAEREFRRAIELKADMPEAWNNLGLACSQQRKNKDAVDAFKKALTLDASMAEAYSNLGLLYHINLQYDKAVEMFRKSLERGDNSGIAYANLGNSLHALKRHKEAVDAWEKALEIDPQNEEARRALESFHRKPEA